MTNLRFFKRKMKRILTGTLSLFLATTSFAQCLLFEDSSDKYFCASTEEEAVFSFSTDCPYTGKVEFEAMRVKNSILSFTGGDMYVYVRRNDNWEKLDWNARSAGISTSWKKFTIDIPDGTTGFRFYTGLANGTLNRHIRNLKVYKRNVLKSGTQTLDFGNVEIGETKTANFELEYSNEEAMSFSFSNPKFSTTEELVSCAYGKKAIAVTFDGSSFGTQTGTLVLRNGQTLTINLLAKVNLLPAPASLNGVSTDIQTVELNWSEVSKATSYKVINTTTGDSFVTTSTNATITGLEMDTNYKFDVVTYYNDVECNRKTVEVKTLGKPVIYTQPADVVAYENGSTELVIVAEENSVYQWYQNGELLEGATNSSLVLSDLTKESDGYTYYCVVSKNGTDVTSDTAVLSVKYNAPTELNFVGNSTVKVGDLASLLVESDAKEVSFVWSNEQSGNAYSNVFMEVGNYTVVCTASNEGGSLVKEFEIQVIAADKAEFLTDIESTTVYVGESLELSVEVDIDDVTYQWYKNNEIVEGETAATIVVTDLTKENAGDEYYCVVNHYGTESISNKAVVNVLYNKPTNLILTQDSDAIAGGKVVLEANAEGEALTYVWSDGTVGQILETPIFAEYGDFYYACTVSNEGGSIEKVIKVVVAPYPNLEILAQPQDVNVLEGESAEFAVEVAEEVAYQWYKNNEIIAGAVEASLTLNDVAKADDGSEVICKMTIYGTTFTSSVAKLGVKYVAPTDLQITAESVKAGEKTTLTVTANGKELSYLWSNGATTSVIETEVFEMATTQDFACTVSNESGMAVAEYTLVVNPADAPVIVAQPQSTSVFVGETANFFVDVEDGASIQWFVNDNAIEGAVSNSLIIENATKEQHGNVYYCVVTKFGSSSISEVASLDVLYMAPTNAVATIENEQIFSQGDDVIIMVSAEGEGLSYQWYFENEAIENATESQLVIEQIALGSFGAYYCKVANESGEVTSNMVDVKVAPKTVAIVANEKVKESENIEFTLAEIEEGAVYTWLVNDELFEDTQMTYSWSDAGVYEVKVKPSYKGVEGEYATAVVTVVPNVAIDSIIIDKTNYFLGDTVVIKISNYDEDYDYVWDSETAEILYQNGDSVVVVWNEIGGQTLVVTPSKNGISGDEIVYNFDIKEEVIIPVEEKPIGGNKEDEDSEENNDPVAVETEAVSVLAYPNPTVDIVNVKVSGAVDVVAIELYDLLGRKLMTVDGSTTEISLQGMTKGVYKLMVRTQTKTMVTSVILK